MHTDAVLLCYKAGFVGWALVRSAIAAPLFLWMGVWCRSEEPPIHADTALLALGWPLCLALQFVAAALWLDRAGATSGPPCNNDIRAMPDLTLWMLLHYVALMTVHCAVDTGRWWPGWWQALRTVFYLIGVPAVLVWSENTTVPFALAGAGFGIATGLVHAMLYTCVWRPRLPLLHTLAAEIKQWRADRAFEHNATLRHWWPHTDADHETY